MICLNRFLNGLVLSAETGYAQATLMTILVSVIGPFLVRLLVTWEDWKPAVAERVVIMKLFFLRALNLSTFLYRYYYSRQILIINPISDNFACMKREVNCTP